MIPKIKQDELNPTVRKRIEHAIVQLPVDQKYNLNKIFNQFVDDTVVDYGDPTSDSYAKHLEKLGLNTTNDIYSSIWLFFQIYHVGYHRPLDIPDGTEYSVNHNRLC